MRNGSWSEQKWSMCFFSGVVFGLGLWWRSSFHPHDSKSEPKVDSNRHHHLLIKLNPREAWRVRLMTYAFGFQLRASHLWMIFSGCKCGLSETELPNGSFFLVGRCFIIVPSYLVTSKGRWKPTQAGCLKGQQSACICGLAVGGGGGQVGWEADGAGFVPSAQQKGELKTAAGPPLPLTAFRETPYHPTSTIHF